MARTVAYRRMEAAATILARLRHYLEAGLLDGSERITVGGFPICTQGMFKKFLEESEGHPQFQRVLTKEIAHIANRTATPLDGSRE